ncbi:MAG: LytR C-terminal domain-containing protein [Nitrospinota bacterium]
MMTGRLAVALSVLAATLVVSAVAWAQDSPLVASASPSVAASPSAGSSPIVERMWRTIAEVARRQEELMALMDQLEQGMVALRRELEAEQARIEVVRRGRAADIAQGYRSHALPLDELYAVSIAVVQVGRPGVARRLGRGLQRYGLDISYASRSPAATRSRTTVYYRPGHRQVALALARLVPGWQDIYPHAGPAPPADLFIVPGRFR